MPSYRWATSYGRVGLLAETADQLASDLSDRGGGVRVADRTYRVQQLMLVDRGFLMGRLRPALATDPFPHEFALAARRRIAEAAEDVRFANRHDVTGARWPSSRGLPAARAAPSGRLGVRNSRRLCAGAGRSGSGCTVPR